MSFQGEQSKSAELKGIKAPRKFAWGGTVGGAILFALSIVFITGGLELGLGSPLRLGTGAFPFLTGVLLATLALAICIQELRGSGLDRTPDWISFLAISAALAVFAGTADRAGLVPATFLTVIVASLPDRNLTFIGKAILGGAVSLASWALFIEALNLPFKPFVAF